MAVQDGSTEPGWAIPWLQRRGQVVYKSINFAPQSLRLA
jgi:hypothetical protein